MQTKNLYDVLGVSKDASDEDVKRAYKKIALDSHPDRNPGDAAAEAKFKEASGAFAVLSDKEKRAAYDISLNPPEPRVRFHHVHPGGFDFSGFDPFEDLIGNMGRRVRRTVNVNEARRKAVQDANIEMQLAISLEEAAAGCMKEVQSQSVIKSVCTRCNGKRAEPGTGTAKCGSCGGTGRSNMFLHAGSTGPCVVCKGVGENPLKFCSLCEGKGETVAKRSVKVKVPAGIDSGQKLRLAGMGNSGMGTIAPGDLFVEITVAPHPVFKRTGLDLHMDHKVSLVEAVRGGRSNVTTLGGKRILINIPPNMKPGETMVVAKGYGIRSTMRTEQGDLHIRLHLKLPEAVTPRAQKLMDELLDEIERSSPRS